MKHQRQRLFIKLLSSILLGTILLCGCVDKKSEPSITQYELPDDFIRAVSFWVTSGYGASSNLCYINDEDKLKVAIYSNKDVGKIVEYIEFVKREKIR